MIDKVLNFLMIEFNKSPDAKADESMLKVAFPTGPKDTIEFVPGTNLLLLNIEQENSLRPIDRYLRVDADGKSQRIHPEIRLNLLVLFVANYNNYDVALRGLSSIIRFFQRHPLFSPQTEPPINDVLHNANKIEQLVVELVTPSLSEQNDIWNGLRLHYHPSVLYKIKTLVFQDNSPQDEKPILSIEMTTSDTNKPPYKKQATPTKIEKK